jgi:hypothetical protein
MFVKIATKRLAICGGRISKVQLIKPLQFLVNVQKLKLPTIPGLRILRVSGWHLLYQFKYSFCINHFCKIIIQIS